MKKVVKITLVETEDSILFGVGNIAYTGSHLQFIDGEIGTEIKTFEITVNFDGRIYKKRGEDLAKDIAAGLNSLKSCAYTDFGCSITSSDLPEKYPLSHPNKSAEFRHDKQMAWKKLLAYIEYNKRLES